MNDYPGSPLRNHYEIPEEEVARMGQTEEERVINIK